METLVCSTRIFKPLRLRGEDMKPTTKMQIKLYSLAVQVPGLAGGIFSLGEAVRPS